MFYNNCQVGGMSFKHFSASQENETKSFGVEELLRNYNSKFVIKLNLELNTFKCNFFMRKTILMTVCVLD